MHSKCNVLLLYIEMIPSIILCGHSQLTELNRLGSINYKAVKVDDISKSDCEWADIVFIGRFDSIREQVIVEYLHKIGKYIIYIIDDDLLNIPDTISTAAYYQKKDTKKRIRKMISLSDALLSPSEKILQKYTQPPQSALVIEEPALLPAEFASHSDNTSVSIGFSGSVDRVSDLESILESVLEYVHNKYADKVRFTFFGAIPSFAKNLNAEVIPYCYSYEEYLTTMHSLSWDIGLAPMPQTDFHSCKHYIKFIEYSQNATVGIFSKTDPYTRLSMEDIPCSFCNNTFEDWVTAICYWIDNPEERENARINLLNYSSRYSITAVSNAFYKMYQAIFEYRSPAVRSIPIWVLDIVFYIRKLNQAICDHGIAFPIWALRKILQKVIKKSQHS